MSRRTNIMKKTYTHRHKDSLLSVEDLCKLKGFKYLGYLVCRDTHEILFEVGQIIKIGGKYYTTELSTTNIGDIKLSTLNCTPIEEMSDFDGKFKNFNLDQFILMDNCDIFIDLYDTDIDEEENGPLWSLGYEMNSIEKAQERIRNEENLDIMVNETINDKASFMAMKTSLQAVTAWSA